MQAADWQASYPVRAYTQEICFGQVKKQGSASAGLTTLLFQGKLKN